MKTTRPQTRPAHTETLAPGITLEMMQVPGGRFFMGSEAENAFLNEKSVHQVQPDDFYMAKFPVTQQSSKNTSTS